MRKYAIAAAVGLSLFFVLAVAQADQPVDGPPGQGECSHGASGQDCKPDPQPEHGKDCEEHGPNEGGVNEDHCLTTTTTTSTTTVTTTTTAVTTTTTAPPSPTTTTTTSVTAPTRTPTEEPTVTTTAPGPVTTAPSEPPKHGDQSPQNDEREVRPSAPVGLAYTGDATGVLATIAVVLLIGGVAFFLLGWRRR